MENKLDTKDLIYIGAFTALYVLLRFIAIMTLGLVPILYLLLPFFTGVICATVYKMYVAKIEKPKAITILAVLLGVILLTMGHFYSVFLCVPIGLLAESVAKIGDYKSSKTQALSYLVFNFTMITPFGQMYLSKDAFVSGVIASNGEEYGQLLANILDKFGNYLFIIQSSSAVIGSIIGLCIASLLFKKHFKHAGIV